MRGEGRKRLGAHGVRPAVDAGGVGGLDAEGDLQRGDLAEVQIGAHVGAAIGDGVAALLGVIGQAVGETDEVLIFGALSGG